MKEKIPLAVYIHIPFCIKKCEYCDFLSAAADENTKQIYIQALKAEIYNFKQKANKYQIKSIFFGGGTPSSIEAEQIAEVLKSLWEVFEWKNEKEIEITIECNPGTLTKEKLLCYRQAGINRLSIGLQSADEIELKLLGRIHTYEIFEENYQLARKIGFKNINIDLMSALPNQTLEKFQYTLKKVVSLNPEHLSVYSLIIEENTPFYSKYFSKIELPSEEEDREIYAWTRTYLRENGYFQYEISNYAKEGYESFHNNTYWKRGEYVGFGLGASSFLTNERYHNETNLKQYIKSANNGKDLRREIEKISVKDAMAEFMFLGLRRIEGISKQEFLEQFQVPIDVVYGNAIKKMRQYECIEEKGDFLYLTEKGIDISNSVMCEFLL